MGANDHLAGSWVSEEDGAALRFLPDERFVLALPNVSTPALRGRCQADANVLTFMHDVDTGVCVGIAGVYRYEIDGERLRLTLVSDACRERMERFAAGWIRRGR